MLDKGNRQAEDVGQAVIWLDGPGAGGQPVAAEITTADKAFSPHVLVVPVGSTVSFPNHDPFNHNVFSLSDEQPFDLGLYGRGETRSVRFTRAGRHPRLLQRPRADERHGGGARRSVLHPAGGRRLVPAVPGAARKVPAARLARAGATKPASRSKCPSGGLRRRRDRSSTPGATASSPISTSMASRTLSRAGGTEDAARAPRSSPARRSWSWRRWARPCSSREAAPTPQPRRRRHARSGPPRSAIGDALVSRSQSLRQLTAALVQVPAYVSRIGEALRTDDRANLLDQADELRAQTGRGLGADRRRRRRAQGLDRRSGTRPTRTSPAAR